MKKKVFLPVCHKDYFNKILILVVVLNIIPFVIKFVNDSYINNIFLKKNFNSIQIIILIISLIILIIGGVSTYFYKNNRFKYNNFIKKANRVQGQIIWLESIEFNSTMSEEEKRLFNLYKKEDKDKYSFFGSNLGKKIRYRVKVRYFNNFKNDYDVIYSDWYDDYRWFSYNLDRFSSFLAYDRNNVNKYYSENLELVDVYYDNNDAVVGNFYKK